MRQICLFATAAMIAPASSLLQSCKSAGAATDETKPYNIVYIMTDDHTAQMLSAYDTRYAHTPNLDRIASDGVKFNRSFVANSLSGPSRACILTGKHSHACLLYTYPSQRDRSTCRMPSSA